MEICNWLPARSDSLVSIESKFPFVKMGVSDTPSRLASKSNRYSSKDSWEAIRVKHPRVERSKLIWFSMAIPRHAFFFWLEVKDCLPTENRLLKWEAKGEVKCLFCRSCIEYRDRLFF